MCRGVLLTLLILLLTLLLLDYITPDYSRHCTPQVYCPFPGYLEGGKVNNNNKLRSSSYKPLNIMTIQEG